VVASFESLSLGSFKNFAIFRKCLFGQAAGAISSESAAGKYRLGNFGGGRQILSAQPQFIQSPFNH